MDAETDAARLRLEAWREQGTDRLDPLRFGFIAALESRRHAHAGEARRLLDERLSALLHDFARAVAMAQRDVGVVAVAVADASAGATAVTTTAAVTAHAPGSEHADDTLGELVARLARHRAEGTATGAATASRDADTACAPETPVGTHADGGNAGEGDIGDGNARDDNDAAFSSPPLLDEFRQLWDDVRGDSRLRQSPEQAPADAGPLNSAALAHRAIACMRELSPGYARHFLAYVETLAWLERMPGAAAPAASSASPGRRPAARTRSARSPRPARRSAPLD